MPTELTAYILHSSGLSGGKRKPTAYSLFGSSDSDSDTPNDVDPGLAQDRDSSESVTNRRDINGNQQNMCANVLWNYQYALLADETDGN